MSRFHRPTLAALTAIFAFGVLMAKPATAQTTATASVQAIALVSGVAPITATGVNDLSFGTVTAGTPSTPADPASQAGRFNIGGEPSAGVTVSFTLPIQLTGPGGNIPISFGTSDGLIWSPFPTTFTTFDPNVPLVSALTAAGTLTVGITGTVSPPSGTTTGTYTGTITLTVSYL
jgi:Domain of unknown function (DUF4402)